MRATVAAWAVIVLACGCDRQNGWRFRGDAQPDTRVDVRDASDVPDVRDVPDGGCVGGRDLPGDYEDCDRDGVDGVAGETIFVSANGRDTNTGLTPLQPVRTLERAMQLLRGTSGVGRRSILIQSGVYDTSVLVTDPGGSQYVEPLFWIDRGMTISGGYTEDWVHTAAGSRTALRAIDVGLIVTGTRGCGMTDEITPLPASAAVTLNNLTLNVLYDVEMGTRTRSPGSNCVGLLLRRVEAPVTLKSVELDVCLGEPGLDGTAGAAPSPPMPGGDALGRGGGSGGLGCGRSVANRGGAGGAGGAGGVEIPGEAGEAGRARGDAGTIGGSGGSMAAAAGFPGASWMGTPTTPAANGDQGDAPLWACDGPVRQLGGNGRDGVDGVGGGGGGGGAAGSVMADPGGGGGGGGGGGCGGRGGAGGGSGGASVGVYAYYSCNLRFETNGTTRTVTITARGGGVGGAGGTPSPAGDGGASGAGASSPDSGTGVPGGTGGAGGAGSPGQPGGRGGGGQGGVSVGVLAVGCPSLPPNLGASLTVNLGAGGRGGPPHLDNRGVQTAIFPVAHDGGVPGRFPCSQLPEMPRGAVVECPRDGGT